MPISLDKVQSSAPELVSLVKTADSALTQKSLHGTVARVALVLDYSGSMHRQYSSGAMQALAEKVLALGLNLDDDGAIDFFVFDSGAAHLGEITLEDFRGSVDRLTAGRSMGSTNYAAAFSAVHDHYFATPVERKFFSRRAVAEVPTPVYALFLTDGEPNEEKLAAARLKELSKVPIFWKFLSIGAGRIRFLEQLDDMRGRLVDNADYQAIGDVIGVRDEQLYPLLLEEYPEWLAAVRAKGLIG